MTPQNLAVVFAPNLLRPKEQGSDLKSITTTLIQVLLSSSSSFLMKILMALWFCV